MKRFIFLIAAFSCTLCLLAQRQYHPSTNSILSNSNTCIYNMPDLMTNQKITVENYTNNTASFKVLCYSASNEWSFLVETPKLLPYKEAHGSGIITKKSYMYQYRESIRMENRESFQCPISKLAILASTGELCTIKIVENGFNLIVKIYPEGTDGYLTSVGNPYINDSIQENIVTNNNGVEDEEDDFIYRTGNDYVYKNCMYDKKTIQPILRNYSPIAYEHFIEGYNLSSIGWNFFFAGLGIELAGDILLGVSGKKTSSGLTSGTRMYIGGCVLTSLGAICLSTGVTCLCVGYGQMHNAASLYNIKVETKNEIRLNATYTGNGVGITLAW